MNMSKHNENGEREGEGRRGDERRGEGAEDCLLMPAAVALHSRLQVHDTSTQEEQTPAASVQQCKGLVCVIT